MKEKVINNTANKKNKTMPKFPKNTNSFMKYSEKGSSFPFKSPMKNTTELESKGKKLIIDTPVSGSQQVKNLEKYKELGKNDPNYAKTLNLSKQRAQSESEDSKKS